MIKYIKNTILMAILFIIAIMFLICCRKERYYRDDAETVNKNGKMLNGPDNGLIKISDKDGEEEVSIKDIMALEAVNEEIITRDDKGNVEREYTVKGVLFDDLVRFLGKDYEDISSIKLNAKDGYMVEIPEPVIRKKRIILAYEMDNKPLFEKSKPIRVFIPGEEEMYWARGIVKISIKYYEDDPGDAQISKLVFLETKLSLLDKSDYQQSGQKAVKASDILDDAQFSETVFFSASDGLEKNEDLTTFIKGFLITEGEDAPSFKGPDIKLGMHVKNIVWFSSGDTGYFSFYQGAKIFDSEEFAGHKGILLRRIGERYHLRNAKIYLIKSLDGKSTELKAEDYEKAVIFQRAGEGISIIFGAINAPVVTANIISVEAAG